MSTTPVVLLAVLWYLRSCKDDSLPELQTQKYVKDNIKISVKIKAKVGTT